MTNFNQKRTKMKTRFKFLFLLIVLFFSIPAHAKWTSKKGYDRMNGEVTMEVFGKLVSPEKPLPRPHHDIQATFVYKCNEGWEGLFIGFNKNLHFAKMQRDEDGYLWTEMRMNFDNDKFTELLLTGNPSSSVVFYNELQKYLHKVMHSSSALVEVVIQGTPQPAYFNFNLAGAKGVITKARQNCKL